MARQDILSKERSDAMGDPVWGRPTPFTRWMDRGARQATSSLLKRFRNFSVSPKELDKTLERSKLLSTPLPVPDSEMVDPREGERKLLEHNEAHNIASEAVNRILSLKNSSSKDRLRVSVQRCIEIFGRHETDLSLGGQIKALRLSAAPAPPPPPPHIARRPDASEETSPTVTEQPAPSISKLAARQPLKGRAGPDTGSSEVQIAILTAKIRVLATALRKEGRMDKMNKRNLRLLVHKRQKLLKYLHRKERGGPRWTFLIEKLGLTEGTWRGEISL